MDRRSFIKIASLTTAGFVLPVCQLQAKTYLTLEQAKKLILGDVELQQERTLELSKEQMKSIQSASKTRVRNNTLQTWKTEQGDWFILDQVIGKHENIDIAVGLSNDGKVKGIEILTYRETYGYEVAHPKWRAQFHGRDHSQVLKLDKQIKNISGATLSSRHITDGINRLTHTWDQVLQHL